jgi:hypothetical protein
MSSLAEVAIKSCQDRQSVIAMQIALETSLTLAIPFMDRDALPFFIIHAPQPFTSLRRHSNPVLHDQIMAQRYDILRQYLEAGGRLWVLHETEDALVSYSPRTAQQSPLLDPVPLHDLPLTSKDVNNWPTGVSYLWKEGEQWYSFVIVMQLFQCQDKAIIEKATVCYGAMQRKEIQSHWEILKPWLGTSGWLQGVTNNGFALPVELQLSRPMPCPNVRSRGDFIRVYQQDLVLQ